MNRSLIICEGISHFDFVSIHPHVFPHYMWGYIVYLLFTAAIHPVPSLYVRVYPKSDAQLREHIRSLIICEGISTIKRAKRKRELFPHYMWGYIELGRKTNTRLKVPSLYVRVYRKLSARWKDRLCSLIICEGISSMSSVLEGITKFPHYMWGYIGALYQS